MKQFIECPVCGRVQLKTLIHPHQMIRCKQCDKEANIALWPVLPAISIRQPWAWLIVRPDLEGEERIAAIKAGLIKDIENRNNLKNFKGKFLIHASMQWDNSWLQQRQETRDILSQIPMPLKDEMQYGGIIGHATITGFVTESDSPWFVGKYGLKIEDPHPLLFTPCKGKLSFFKPEIA